MSWYVKIVESLQQGKDISFRPKGNSMTPKIKSGQLVTVTPIQLTNVVVDDIVLCKVKGSYFLHLVTAIKDGQLQISNNHGHVNGWTTKVFGKVTRVE